jgi:PPM family protein phosphatase
VDDQVGLPVDPAFPLPEDDPNPALSLVWAAASVTGLVRAGNEDSLYAGRSLLAVADGIGGHAAGEVASAAVIVSLRAQDREVAPGELLKFLVRAVEEANAEVARRAAEDMSRFGMGTTLTALLWSGHSAAMVHVGDSRGFRLRDGRLRQMTEDHVLGKLVSNAGWMAPMLTRYLDGRPDLSPDLALRELRLGDRYLLCSDGLSPVVSDTAIRDVLVAAAGPREAAGWLVALAEEAGGPDNISVIVIDVRDAADEPVVPEPVVLGAAAAELLPC